MKIRNELEFQEFVDGRISRRYLEISSIDTVVQRTSVKDPNMAVAIRKASVLLLYAHWEGFAKDLVQAFVAFVASQRLPMNGVSDALIACKARHYVSRSNQSSQATTFRTAIGFRDTNEHWKLEPELVGDAKSNLSFSTLSEILISIGANPSQFDDKAVFIDNVLLKKRNALAHGSDSVVDYSDYETIREGVRECMRRLKDVVENMVSNQGYRRVRLSP